MPTELLVSPMLTDVQEDDFELDIDFKSSMWITADVIPSIYASVDHSEADVGCGSGDSGGGGGGGSGGSFGSGGGSSIQIKTN